MDDDRSEIYVMPDEEQAATSLSPDPMSDVLGDPEPLSIDRHRLSGNPLDDLRPAAELMFCWCRVGNNNDARRYFPRGENMWIGQWASIETDELLPVEDVWHGFA